MARRTRNNGSADIVKVSAILFAIIVASFWLGESPNLDIAKATGFGSALKNKE